jgi:hypothetical protein
MLNPRGIKAKIQTGTDAHFEDFATGTGNPLAAQVLTVLIPHRYIDEAREDIF